MLRSAAQSCSMASSGVRALETGTRIAIDVMQKPSIY
jgi:hypothetical protein